MRKNERLKYPFSPQPHTKLDKQTVSEYETELADFNYRKNYVYGSHVKSQYTMMAHYFLIKRMLHSEKWNFISDDDASIQNCIFKMFSDKFLENNANYFTCRYEQKLSNDEAKAKSLECKKKLWEWAEINKISHKGLKNIAYQKLLREVKNHTFYNYKVVDGKKYPVRGNNPIAHPLPDADEGTRWVNLISYRKNDSPEELTDLIMQVNSKTINNFYEIVRRRISILERPLNTARADGMSYIYANYNPKYAQEIFTILRTFYNFCWASKGENRGVGRGKGKGIIGLTPAQRIGITDKIFNYKDIIYFR